MCFDNARMVMKSLSLCLIAGNVEHLIERCVRSFQPYVQEIVIVRAIGNQQPDATLDKARSLGCRCYEYKNAEGNNWPHVDDFGKARQMSFDMASNNLVMWADTDDIIEEQSGKNIRTFIDDCEFDVAVFPYKLRNNGLRLPRARIIRKGMAKWTRPIHEDLLAVDGARFVVCDDIEIIHFPEAHKDGSNSRNLTILNSIRDEDKTAGDWYYTHSEKLGLKDWQGSFLAGKKAITDPACGDVEKVDIFCNLAQMPDVEPKQKLTFLMEAAKIQPWRREPYALLTCLAVDHNDSQRALAFSRAMLAQPEPREIPWTHRAALYSWLGDTIAGQALRCAGKYDEADKIEGATPSTISLLHATRGRAHEASVIRTLWLTRAANPSTVEHIFAFAEDDTESMDGLRRFNHVVTGKADGITGGTAVANWNAAAKKARGKVLIVIADDYEPPMGWDEAILQRLDINRPQVLSVENKCKLISHPIITRRYYDLDGYVFHPEFRGVFCDNYFTMIATNRGAVVEAKDLEFYHHHPVNGDRECDEVTAIMNTTEAYEYGQQVMNRLCALT